MTRKFAALAAFVLFALGAPLAHAQPLSEVPINDKTAIFCRDNTGTPVLQTYANLGAVMRRWKERFQFDMSIEAGSPLKVVFSNPTETPYSFTYSVQPYRDEVGRTGILLLSMHLFLENADRDIDGSPMCYFTEFGK
jgi:hypothetical protein